MDQLLNAIEQLYGELGRIDGYLYTLVHPNLVAAVDVFVEAGYLFLVMEKVEGPTLGQVLYREPAAGDKPVKVALGPRRALVTARQILDGAGHAHAHHLVHRDLKPDNILLLDMGGWERVKIIDFGIVKLLGDAAAAFGASALTNVVWLTFLSCGLGVLGFLFGALGFIAPTLIHL